MRAHEGGPIRLPVEWAFTSARPFYLASENSIRVGFRDIDPHRPNSPDPSSPRGRGERRKDKVMGDTPIPPALQATDARMRWDSRRSPRPCRRQMRECGGIRDGAPGLAGDRCANTVGFATEPPALQAADARAAPRIRGFDSHCPNSPGPFPRRRGEKRKDGMMGDTPTPPALRAAGARIARGS